MGIVTGSRTGFLHIGKWFTTNNDNVDEIIMSVFPTMIIIEMFITIQLHVKNGGLSVLYEPTSILLYLFNG